MNMSQAYDRFFATYPIYQRFQPVQSFRELHDRIKYILEHFGYISSRHKNISKGTDAKQFTSGMHYEFDPNREVLRLVTTPTIVRVNHQL